MRLEEQRQYHADLLEWCDTIFPHWENMKPRFFKLFDLKILQEWEKSFNELKETLQSDDVKANFDDYQAANSLYEKWDMLYKEAHDFQEEMLVTSDRSLEMEEEKPYHEDLLEWCDTIFFHWESMKPRFSKHFDFKSLEEWEESFRDLKERLQTNLKGDFEDYQIANGLFEKWESLYKETYAYQELI